MVSFWGDQGNNREKKAEQKGLSVFGSLDGGGSRPKADRGTAKHDTHAKPSGGSEGGWSFMMGGNRRVEVPEPKTRWEGEFRDQRGRARSGWAQDHGDAVETFEQPRWQNRVGRAARAVGDRVDDHLERKIERNKIHSDATYGEWAGETTNQIVGTSRNVFSLAARALARRWF